MKNILKHQKGFSVVSVALGTGIIVSAMLLLFSVVSLKRDNSVNTSVAEMTAIEPENLSITKIDGESAFMFGKNIETATLFNTKTDTSDTGIACLTTSENQTIARTLQPSRNERTTAGNAYIFTTYDIRDEDTNAQMIQFCQDNT
jgi:outer membrane lipoprotein-sorting protein